MFVLPAPTLPVEGSPSEVVDDNLRIEALVEAAAVGARQGVGDGPRGVAAVAAATERPLLLEGAMKASKLK